MVPCDNPPMSVVWQGALVITDVEPGFRVSFGAADVGSGSSSEVRQISPLCFPIPPVVASLSGRGSYFGEASVQGKGGFFSCGDSSHPFYDVGGCSCYSEPFAGNGLDQTGFFWSNSCFSFSVCGKGGVLVNLGL
jgi:hypothetical protein